MMFRAPLTKEPALVAIDGRKGIVGFGSGAVGKLPFKRIRSSNTRIKVNDECGVGDNLKTKNVVSYSVSAQKVL
jgi:hypothetical protein